MASLWWEGDADQWAAVQDFVVERTNVEPVPHGRESQGNANLL